MQRRADYATSRFWGAPCTSRYAQNAFAAQLSRWATTTQRLDWYHPEALHTKAYERVLILALINSTVRDVVAKEDVSYDALLGVMDRWVATTVEWSKVASFSVIGIDEIALTKGRRNVVAVITAQTEHGVHVLAILPDRAKATIVAWLRSVPVQRRASITTVCTDM